MKFIAVLLATLTILVGCRNKQNITEQRQVAKLEFVELEDDKKGASEFYNRMKLACSNNEFLACRQIYSVMAGKYPRSEVLLEAKALRDKTALIELQQKKETDLLNKKKKEERERERDKELKIKQVQEKKYPLTKLKKYHDDISGVTWYHNPQFTHEENNNLVSIYLGHKGKSNWLILKMSYVGDNWIFFEKAYLSYDGNTHEVIFDKYKDKKKENGSGSVWEWIEVPVSTTTERYLRAFASSKNAKMRLSGKYTKTRRLSANERQGILDILDGYKDIKGK